MKKFQDEYKEGGQRVVREVDCGLTDFKQDGCIKQRVEGRSVLWIYTAGTDRLEDIGRLKMERENECTWRAFT